MKAVNYKQNKALQARGIGKLSKSQLGVRFDEVEDLARQGCPQSALDPVADGQQFAILVARADQLQAER